jgi:superfamily I DNA and/or RNA helicase
MHTFILGVICSLFNVQTGASKHESGLNSAVGFFNNPKRFNVAITRAMALLVVVGHPAMLKSDPQWGQLVCMLHALRI